MIDLVKKAWNLAEKGHKGVTRKFSGIPYFEGHVVKVYEFVKKFTNDPELLAASLLHDTLEDVEWITEEMILEEFGQRVLNIVKELTSDDIKVKEMGKANYLLEKMTNQSDDALLIKLCDRLANISDYPTQSDSFRQKYYKETRFIMNNLVKKRKLNQTQQEAADMVNEILSEMEKRHGLKYLESFSNFKNK